MSAGNEWWHFFPHPQLGCCNVHQERWLQTLSIFLLFLRNLDSWICGGWRKNKRKRFWLAFTAEKAEKTLLVSSSSGRCTRTRTRSRTSTSRTSSRTLCAGWVIKIPLKAPTGAVAVGSEAAPQSCCGCSLSSALRLLRCHTWNAHVVQLRFLFCDIIRLPWQPPLHCCSPGDPRLHVAEK